jgi:hypothetical protein
MPQHEVSSATLRSAEVDRLMRQRASAKAAKREHKASVHSPVPSGVTSVTLVTCSAGHENHPSRTVCGVCEIPITTVP